MNVLIQIKSQGRQVIELVTAAVNVITSRTFSYPVNFEREGEGEEKKICSFVCKFSRHICRAK